MNAQSARYSTRYRLYVLFLILVTTIVSVMDRSIVAILVNDIKRDLAISDTQLGLLGGVAFSAVHVVAGIPIARWADVGVRRSIMSMGIVAWSVMTCLAGMAQGFWQLFAARMGVGIGEAAGSPPATSLISDYFPPQQRGRALSVLSVGGIAGGGVGMVVGGILSEAVGWRMTLVYAGLFGIALGAVVRATLAEPPRGWSEGGVALAKAEPLRAVLAYLRGLPSFWWMMAGMSLTATSAFGKTFWEPAFLMRVYEYGPRDAGISYFLMSPLPSLVGAALGGVAADALGRRDERWYVWIAALSGVASLPFAVAFLLWPESHRIGGLPVAFGFSVVASLIGAAFSPATLAMGQGLARPHMRALVHAIWSMVMTFIGMGVGPLLVGGLSDALTPQYGDAAVRYALLAGNLPVVLGAGCFLVAARTLRDDLAFARQGAPLEQGEAP